MSATDRNHSAVHEDAGDGWICKTDEMLGLDFDICKPDSKPLPLKTYEVLYASGIVGYAMEDNPYYAPAARLMELVDALVDVKIEDGERIVLPETGTDPFELVLKLDHNPHILSSSIGLQPLHLKNKAIKVKTTKNTIE